MSRHLLEPEPDMSKWVGQRVVYRRDDGSRSTAIVVAYDRDSGRYSLRTKQSELTIRHWSGVGHWSPGM